MASRRQAISVLALGAAGLISSGVAGASERELWPSRPIRMITPTSPGSGTDALARALARRLSEALGHQVVVDNRPGGGGVIGVGAVAKAPNDGYTLLYANASPVVIAPAILKSVPYDTARELVPVAQTAVGGVFLLVNDDVPAKNLRELIDLVKANPGKYSYGTWATGSSGHLLMEWLQKRAGIKMAHVPYRTVSQMLSDLSSGVLPIAWADPGSPLPFVRSGRIRGIAVSGAARGPQLPDVATLGEQGYPFDTVGWFGVFAPAGTNPGIAKRLAEEVNRVQASPEMADLMKSMNFEPPPVKTQAQFQDIVRTDLQTWKKLAADAGVALEN